jgi:Tfp pilus assembly protein PilN
MEKIDINLLPTATRFQLQKIRLAKKLEKYAYIAAGVCLVVMPIVFITKFLLIRRYQQLENEKKQLNASLANLNAEFQLQQSLRLRLKLVTEVLNKRIDMSANIDQLLEILPPSTEISNINADKNKLEVRGLIKGLADVNQLENRITKLKSSDDFVYIKLNSLVKAEDGWSFSLEVKLKPKTNA